jgi:hypothetical protein
MRNRAGNFSGGRLMEFLTALGQDVRITVKPTRKARGEMAVVARCPPVTRWRRRIIPRSPARGA